MHHNGSGKFESIFINVTIPENNSVLMSSLAGARLGVWVAHGEGRFVLPEDKSKFQIAATYSHLEYPGNPNDSDFAVAALLRKTDGTSLSCPHLERSLYSHGIGDIIPQCERMIMISPWIEPFINARDWVKKHS